MFIYLPLCQCAQGSLHGKVLKLKQQNRLNCNIVVFSLDSVFCSGTDELPAWPSPQLSLPSGYTVTSRKVMMELPQAIDGPFMS